MLTKTFTLRSYCQRSISLAYTIIFSSIYDLLYLCFVSTVVLNGKGSFLFCFFFLFKQLSIMVNIFSNIVSVSRNHYNQWMPCMMNAFSCTGKMERKKNEKRTHTHTVSSVPLMALVVFSLSYSSLRFRFACNLIFILVQFPFRQSQHFFFALISSYMEAASLKYVFISVVIAVVIAAAVAVSAATVRHHNRKCVLSVVRHQRNILFAWRLQNETHNR